MKAISQNFGHEHIATTLRSYANYDSRRLTEILKGMDFSGRPSQTADDKLDQILEKLSRKS